jgi:hypothetical protein
MGREKFFPLFWKKKVILSHILLLLCTKCRRSNKGTPRISLGAVALTLHSKYGGSRESV